MDDLGSKKDMDLGLIQNVVGIQNKEASNLFFFCMLIREDKCRVKKCVT